MFASPFPHLLNISYFLYLGEKQQQKYARLCLFLPSSPLNMRLWLCKSQLFLSQKHLSCHLPSEGLILHLEESIAFFLLAGGFEIVKLMGGTQAKTAPQMDSYSTSLFILLIIRYFARVYYVPGPLVVADNVVINRANRNHNILNLIVK